MAYVPNFPPIDNPGWSDLQQAEKIVEEAREAFTEARLGNTADMLEEVMDVIVACETLLRMHPEETDAAYSAVMEKNRNRGYWKEERA